MDLSCAEVEEYDSMYAMMQIHKVEELLVPIERMLAENDFNASEIRAWIICQHFSVNVAWFQCCRKMQILYMDYWQRGEGVALQQSVRAKMDSWTSNVFEFFFGLKR